MTRPRHRTKRAHKDLTALVPRIYEAAAHPEAWGDVLDEVALSVGGVGPGLFVVDRSDPGATFHVARGIDPSWLTAYDAYFHRLDLRRRVMEARPEGTVIAGHQLVPDETLLQSEFYHDFLQPQGFHHILLTMAYKSKGRMGVVRILRPRGAERFGSQELACLRGLQPHLHGAIALHLALAEARAHAETLRTTLAHIAVGFLTLDAQGQLLRTNEVADQLIAKGDGLVLRARTIQTELPADTAKLQQLVGQAAESGLPGTMRIRRSKGPPDLSVRAVPAHGELVPLGVPRPAVLLFIRDPAEAGKISESSLRELFNLTRAEARVAMRLVAGMKSKDVAQELGVSEETVRSHRKQIFLKVDVHNHPELMQRVLAFHAPLSSRKGE